MLFCIPRDSSQNIFFKNFSQIKPKRKSFLYQSLQEISLIKIHAISVKVGMVNVFGKYVTLNPLGDCFGRKGKMLFYSLLPLRRKMSEQNA